MADEIVEGVQDAGVQSGIIEEKALVVESSEPLWYEAEDASFEGIEFSDKDKEFKTLGDYVKNTQSTRSMIGKQGIMPPGEDATPEQRTAFVASMREQGVVVAAAPDAYEVDSISKSELLSDDRKAGIFDAFKKINMSNDQLAGSMEIWGEQMEMDRAEMVEKAAELRTDNIATLKAEWGDGAKDRMAGLERAEGQFPDAMAKLAAVGLNGDMDVLRMLDGVALGTAEDKIDDGDAVGADIDDQISRLKASPAYKGNAFERNEVTAQIGELMKKKFK